MTFEGVILNMGNYIQVLASKFEHNSKPYEKEDYVQVANLGIFEAGQTFGFDHPDGYWKKVIRARMIDFHRSCVEKVNRAEHKYRELSRDDYVPDFSDDVILKVALEECNENTKKC